MWDKETLNKPPQKTIGECLEKHNVHRVTNTNVPYQDFDIEGKQCPMYIVHHIVSAADEEWILVNKTPDVAVYMYVWPFLGDMSTNIQQHMIWTNCNKHVIFQDYFKPIIYN